MDFCFAVENGWRRQDIRGRSTHLGHLREPARSRFPDPCAARKYSFERCHQTVELAFVAVGPASHRDYASCLGSASGNAVSQDSFSCAVRQTRAVDPANLLTQLPGNKQPRGGPPAARTCVVRATEYAPQPAEQTVLHDAVRSHLATFTRSPRGPTLARPYQGKPSPEAAASGFGERHSPTTPIACSSLVPLRVRSTADALESSAEARRGRKDGQRTGSC